MLRLTVTDLMEALRGKDIFDPRDVSYAVIETNGNLSVALRPEREPARLADLQLKTTQTNATIPLSWTGRFWKTTSTGAVRIMPGWNAPQRLTPF